MARSGDDHPRDRRADLPRHQSSGLRERLGGGAEVSVVEHDARRLAAELQRVAGDPLAADRCDPATSRGGPGEGDLVDPRIAHQRLRHLAVGGDDVDDPGRQADVLGHLGEHVARQRRLRRHLDHDRAAGDQRRGRLVGDRRGGRVPRHDDAHHADRFTDQASDVAAGGRCVVLDELEVAGEIGVVVVGGADATDVQAGERVHDAHLARPVERQFLAPGLQRGGEGVEVGGPFGGRQPRPRTVIERCPGRADGALRRRRCRPPPPGRSPPRSTDRRRRTARWSPLTPSPHR